jgi:hypothetical protein
LYLSYFGWAVDGGSMSCCTRVLPAAFRFSRKLRIRSLLLAVAWAACFLDAAGASPSYSVTPDGATSVQTAVRTFMQTVSHSVTQDGAMAWIKYFDASPAFFMAVNGQMAFPNPAAAQEGTRNFAQTIRHIELNWGDDLRVDPLTNEFAVVAVSWREMQVDIAGQSITETGYFTGLAEYREGHWQFRDAHWSSPVSSH